MKNLISDFIRWYRLTHWMYEESWLDNEDGRFILPETQTMYIAYRAGFNRANKQRKM